MDGQPPRGKRPGSGALSGKRPQSGLNKGNDGSNTAKDLKEGNDWIPQGDVIKYNRFKVKREGARGENEEDGDSVGNIFRDTQKHDPNLAAGRYVPSLDRYPLNMLRDVTDPVNDTDIPFLWHIPKAAGSTVKKLLSKCFGLTTPKRSRYPESLDIINGFVNVDISTLPGIARAKDMGLAPSDAVGAIVTSYLHEGAALFTDERKGRLFTVMRHPVRTSESLFYYLGYATWERFYKKEYANMTIEEYATSPMLMDNWMTRYLTREETGTLTEKHVELATQILAQKCVVGLINELDETIMRLQHYFGWKVSKEAPNCLNYYLHEHKMNVHKHKQVKEGSHDWNVLAERSRFDIQVYENALSIFKEQERVIPHLN